MGTFLLESTTVNNKEKGWYIEEYPNNGALVKRKVFNGTESVKVELEFISNGDTSDFTESDIAIILNKLIKELKKE